MLKLHCKYGKVFASTIHTPKCEFSTTYITLPTFLYRSASHNNSIKKENMWKVIPIGIIVFWLAIVSISFFSQDRNTFISQFILATVLAVILLITSVGVRIALEKGQHRKKKKRMYYY